MDKKSLKTHCHYFFSVAMQLFNQLFHRIEFDFITQPTNKVNA